MASSVYGLLIAGTACAAVGQVMFKVGATGRVSLVEFVNPWILAGLTAYGFGTLLWVYSLSRAPLTVAYPFTALTFVLVYLAGVLLLGEQTTTKSMLGVGVVLLGLFLITDS